MSHSVSTIAHIVDVGRTLSALPYTEGYQCMGGRGGWVYRCKNLHAIRKPKSNKKDFGRRSGGGIEGRSDKFPRNHVSRKTTEGGRYGIQIHSLQMSHAKPDYCGSVRGAWAKCVRGEDHLSMRMHRSKLQPLSKVPAHDLSHDKGKQRLKPVPKSERVQGEKVRQS